MSELKYIVDWTNKDLVCEKCGDKRSVKYEFKEKIYCNKCIVCVNSDCDKCSLKLTKDCPEYVKDGVILLKGE